MQSFTCLVRDSATSFFVSYRPLRACVAGFTNITFNSHNHGLIDGAGSYVSFSRYSEAVFLPQDPGRERTAALLAAQRVVAASARRRLASARLARAPGGSGCRLSPLRSGDVPWPRGPSSASSSAVPAGLRPLPARVPVALNLHTLEACSQCRHACVHAPDTQGDP